MGIKSENGITVDEIYGKPAEPLEAENIEIVSNKRLAVGCYKPQTLNLKPNLRYQQLTTKD